MKFCLFLDFDGVLFDTVKESYAVCLSMLNKELGIEDISFDTEHYLEFRKYRYLVAPAWNYKYLLECIDEGGAIPESFAAKVSAADSGSYAGFEGAFFEQRKVLKMKSYDKWLGLNTAFDFFTHIKRWIGENSPEVYIVTTKDRTTVLDLLSLNAMSIQRDKVLGKDAYTEKGSKSAIINSVVEEQGVTHAVFLDDSAFHVENVKKYSNVNVMMPSWGYVPPGAKGEGLEAIMSKINEIAKCTA